MRTRSKTDFVSGAESVPFARHARARAFSLVEVVIAVGVFALAVTAIVGIMSAVGKSVSDLQESEKASRLVSVVQARLQSAGFAAIQGALQTDTDIADEPDVYPASAHPRDSNNPYRFYGSEDGQIVAIYPSAGNEGDEENDPWTLGRSGTTKADRDGLKFFEMALVRNSSLSPTALDADSGYLAFSIRVRWPAFLPNGDRVTDNSQKNVLIVPAAITR